MVSTRTRRYADFSASTKSSTQKKSNKKTKKSNNESSAPVSSNTVPAEVTTVAVAPNDNSKKNSETVRANKNDSFLQKLRNYGTD